VSDDALIAVRQLCLSIQRGHRSKRKGKNMHKKQTKSKNNLIPQERIENKILLIRGIKVIIDRDLAELYGVPTFRLNEQVKRNIERFPEDFMFQLSKEEHDSLRSQFAISKGRGGRRYLPYVFTEQGVAMVSSVLHSPQAVQVNIQIMRTFVRLRELMMSHKDLARKIETLERKFNEHDKNFVMVFEAIKRLLDPPEKPKGRMGFHP